jgi:DNA-directed RNA polymerase subunit L
MPDKSFYKFCYPAYYVKHPWIDHVNMTAKVFMNIEPERLNFEKYIRYYETTYMILATNFDEYEEYLEEKFWNEFKNKRRIKYESK